MRLFVIIYVFPSSVLRILPFSLSFSLFLFVFSLSQFITPLHSPFLALNASLALPLTFCPCPSFFSSYTPTLLAVFLLSKLPWLCVLWPSSASVWLLHVSSSHFYFYACPFSSLRTCLTDFLFLDFLDAGYLLCWFSLVYLKSPSLSNSSFLIFLLVYLTFLRVFSFLYFLVSQF